MRRFTFTPEDVLCIGEAHDIDQLCQYLTMSQRSCISMLPLRVVSSVRSNGAQWICRRCLATQVESTPPAPTMPSFLSTSRPTKDPSEAENYDPTLPASQRDYRLTKTDFYLKKALPQRIPPQYFYHSTNDVIPVNEREQRATAQVDSHKKLIGVVVDTGKMHKTVKVRIPGQRWNLKIKKVNTDSLLLLNT